MLCMLYLNEMFFCVFSVYMIGRNTIDVLIVFKFLVLEFNASNTYANLAFADALTQ